MAVKTLSNDAAGLLFSERRQFHLSPQQVAELDPNVAPFLTLMLARGVRTTRDPDFKLFEHRPTWREESFLINEATPSAWPASGLPGEEQTFTVDGFSGVSLDDALVGLEVEIFSSDLSTYKGVARVEAVNTTNTTVDLQVVGKADATDFALPAIADDDKLYVIGSAFGEGTTAPEASFDELELVYNSAQIFKTAVEVTGTLHEAALRGYSSELARVRTERGKKHKIRQERALLLGMRRGIGPNANDTFATTITDGEGKNVRTTMGLIPILRRYGNSSASSDDQNVFTISEASYDYSDYVDDSEKIFKHTSGNGIKTAVCGGGALSYWSKLDGTSGIAGNSGFSVNISGTQRSRLGFNYRILETPHGVLRLVKSKILEGPYKNHMLIVDDPNVDVVQYRASNFKTNIKTDDAYDGQKDQYFSDMGLGLRLVETHSMIQITA